MKTQPEKIKFLNSLLSPGRYSLIWGKHCFEVLQNIAGAYMMVSPDQAQIERFFFSPEHFKENGEEETNLLIINGECNLLADFKIADDWQERPGDNPDWADTLDMAVFLRKTAYKHNVHILLNIEAPIAGRVRAYSLEEESNDFYKSPLLLLSEEAICITLQATTQHLLNNTEYWEE